MSRARIQKEKSSPATRWAISGESANSVTMCHGWMAPGKTRRRYGEPGRSPAWSAKLYAMLRGCQWANGKTRVWLIEAEYLVTDERGVNKRRDTDGS